MVVADAHQPPQCWVFITMDNRNTTSSHSEELSKCVELQMERIYKDLPFTSCDGLPTSSLFAIAATKQRKKVRIVNIVRSNESSGGRKAAYMLQIT